ncbi:hypothetical protein Taro_033770 [Colocasia esculenta]|uniref:Uncharacterized protein n=1 Tax=Colocasia esculenta TaxID=4460 RepID=A0A843W2C8_COLES|nr:hypothetical protein [Colocasia esculenta]
MAGGSEASKAPARLQGHQDRRQRGVMTQLHRALVPLGLRRSLSGHLNFFCRLLRFLWDRVLACSAGRPRRYRRIRGCPSTPREADADARGTSSTLRCSEGLGGDSDLVELKVCLLGDCHVGKTAFMAKYVEDMEEQMCLQMAGLSLMDKILSVKDVRIAFRIWDVKGDRQFLYHIPIACKDAAAILIMFDLTRRCTLNKFVLPL